jgi:hypothetical protein
MPSSPVTSNERDGAWRRLRKAVALRPLHFFWDALKPSVARVRINCPTDAGERIEIYVRQLNIAIANLCAPIWFGCPAEPR